MDNIEIKKLFIQPDNEAYLYRYVTIDKLIDTIINKRFPLTRLDLFDDNLEGITPEDLIVNLFSDKIASETAKWIGELVNQVAINIDPTKRNSLSKKRKLFQRSNYASCWFVSDHESIAMWQLYSRFDSIAIRIPYISMIKQIESKSFDLSNQDINDLKYGMIQYIRYDDLNSFKEMIVNERMKGFIKDKSFSHESEFRFMVSTSEQAPTPAKNKPFVLDKQVEKINELLDQEIIYLTMNDFYSLPIELIFHPQSKDWHKRNVRDILKQYEIDFKVSDSKLTRIFN